MVGTKKVKKYNILLCLLAGLALFAARPALCADAPPKAAPVVPDAQIIPHRALYDIRMTEKHSGAEIVNVSGQMMFEWHKSCEAWNTTHRFSLVYEYADNPSVKVTSDFSTFETLDGRSLDFSARRRRNGELFEDIRGHAENDRGAPGKKDKVIYTKPDTLKMDLPKGTLFPMSHTLELLRQIKAGKKFFNAVIFDGSDEEGPVEVNAVIGNEVNALAEIDGKDLNKNIDTNLLNNKSWSVHMAFFPLDEDGAEAEYEITARLHENGIISDMDVDYKTFSVSQKLTALEPLENEDCGN